MVRLFANMMGGHMIILSLISLIFIFGAFGAVVIGANDSTYRCCSLCFMLLIDTLVSFIQAYVFYHAFDSVHSFGHKSMGIMKEKWKRIK